MRYFPLIWAGLWRKPVRTGLTLLSVVNAFLLFGLLQGFSSGLANASSAAHADLLFTFSRVSQIEPLPLSLQDRIARAPGVAGVTPMIVFQSTYQKPGQTVRAFAVDAKQFLGIYPGVSVGPSALEAMAQSRSGAIVDRALAAKYGWKVGDRITLRSLLWANKSGGFDWPLDVVGLYDARENSLPANAALVNFAYVDEGRTYAGGTTSVYLLKVANADRASEVGAAVDRISANSPYETRTATEQQMAQDSLRQIGDIGFVVRAIVGAVFFAILFSVSVVMMQAIRERTAELGVLKTLGFADRKVLVLVLAETFFFCLLASGLGLVLAVAAFPAIKAATGFQAQAGPVLLVGLGLASILALVSGLPPAIRAMRLQIVDALSGR